MSVVRVAIVGGGLAGLAAAAALAERGVAVELFEARRRLGGRTASFEDPSRGRTIDHCQHVSLGCCTNLAHFARRVGIDHLFTWHRTLYFIDPAGRRYNFSATGWLPAPLHLMRAFLGLGYLPLGDRLSIARALLNLSRAKTHATDPEPTIGQWLQSQHQSRRAIDQFWSTVLVSALGETVDRAGLHYARKVFVDAFLANRNGYAVAVPRVSLDELYGRRISDWLAQRGVRIRLSSAATNLEISQGTVRAIRFRDGTIHEIDRVILAVPWRRAAELLRVVPGAEAIVRRLDQLTSSPISALHLWFDRPITDLPHAILIGRLSQWLFNRQWQTEAGDRADGHYYQVVISSSRSLAGAGHDEITSQVVAELAEAFPAARNAKLLHARLINDPEAVYSPVPGVDRLRPAQRTSIGGLLLAGDWTATGWPATMESAVRSGYLAAEAVLETTSKHETIVVPELPRSTIVRLITR